MWGGFFNPPPVKKRTVLLKRGAGMADGDGEIVGQLVGALGGSLEDSLASGRVHDFGRTTETVSITLNDSKLTDTATITIGS